MIEIQRKCPLCDKSIDHELHIEKFCSFCGMSIADVPYYMFAGAGTLHYFCSSKCVKSYLASKEVLR